MKKKKIKKYSKVFEKNYLLYREQYKEHRKEGLIKANQRPLTKQQFKEMSKQMGRGRGRGYKYTAKQALMTQSKIGIFTEEEITKIWKQYQKEYEEQGKIEKMVGITWHYIKDVDLSKEISRKFRTVKTLLKNLKTNQLIQLLVDSGYDREEVLEEYGY